MSAKLLDSHHQKIPTTIPLRSVLICLIGLFFLGWMDLLRAELSAMHLLQQFHLSTKDLGYLTSKFSMTYMLTLFSAGIMVDIFGPKKLILSTIILALTGNYIFGHALSQTDLLIGRAITGIAHAFAILSILKMGTLCLPKRHFVLYVGLLFAFGLFASHFGATALSAISNSYGWQHVISFMNASGVILFVLTLFVFNDKNYRGEKRKLISLDGVLSVVKNPKIYATAIVSLFGLLFITNLVGFWGSAFLEQFLHFSKNQAASLIALSIYGFISGTIIAGILSDLIQRKRLLLISGYLLAALLFLCLLYLPNLSYAATSWLLFFTGFLLGTNFLCYALAYDYTSSSNAGLAFGILSLVGVLGTAYIQPIFGKLLSIGAQANFLAGSISYTSASWQSALMIIAVALVIGSLLALYLRKPESSPIEPTSSIWKDMGFYWKGKGNLGRAYWLIKVLIGGFLSTIIISFIAISPTFNIPSLYKLPAIHHLLMLPYEIFATVCVWRCANNTNWWIGWKYITRTIVLIQLFVFCNTMVFKLVH